jgi:hypothetical protein
VIGLIGLLLPVLAYRAAGYDRSIAALFAFGIWAGFAISSRKAFRQRRQFDSDPAPASLLAPSARGMAVGYLAVFIALPTFALIEALVLLTKL